MVFCLKKDYCKMNSSEHWASLPTIQDTESGIAAIEREQMTKPRPLDVEGPALHQPCAHSFSSSYEQCPPKDVQIDPVTRHTIELLQYSRQMRQMIQDLKQRQDTLKSMVSSNSFEIPVAPPLPVIGKSLKTRSDEASLTYLPKDPNNLFARGFGRAPASIDRATSRRLLRQAVAAICVQSGYDACTESALEIITDVTNEFYLQMMTLLRTATDRNAMQGHVGFPDVITRVFAEMGCGSITDIHSYYETRVIGCHDQVHRTCFSLQEEYRRLSKADDQILSDDKTYRMRMEGHRSNDIQDPVDETSDVDPIDQLEGAGVDVSVDPDSLSNMHSEEDSGSRLKTERTSTAKEENRTSSNDDKLLDMEIHSAGDSSTSREFYRQSSDFTSPSFSDITSLISTRGGSQQQQQQPPLKKLKK